MEKNTYLLIDADISYFQERCKYWIDFFGLKDWHIRYMKKDIKPNAEVWMNYPGKIATIVINEIIVLYDGENYKKDLNRSAFHEICHILLDELIYLALKRSIKKSQLRLAEETIIRRLENFLNGG